MNIKITGLDKVQRNLRKLERKASELGGQHSVPVRELFPPSFMAKHTKFESIDAMFETSGFKVETAEDLGNPDWDVFVRSVTNFSDWDEMLTKAGEELVVRRLGL